MPQKRANREDRHSQNDIKTTGPPIKVGYRRIPAGLRMKQSKRRSHETARSHRAIRITLGCSSRPHPQERWLDTALIIRLNQVTVKDSYPCQTCRHLEAWTGPSFPDHRLCSGYWQVKLAENAKDKTSFYGAVGALEIYSHVWVVQCPATFKRLMERVLGQLQWQICLCYLDEILIFGQTVEQHLQGLGRSSNVSGSC